MIRLPVVVMIALTVTDGPDAPPAVKTRGTVSGLLVMPAQPAGAWMLKLVPTVDELTACVVVAGRTPGSEGAVTVTFTGLEPPASLMLTGTAAPGPRTVSQVRAMEGVGDATIQWVTVMVAVTLGMV